MIYCADARVFDFWRLRRVCGARRGRKAAAGEGAEEMIAAAQTLSAACENMQFGAPVSHVYRPLQYAWEPHRAYLQKYAAAPKRALFLGMNPGPWGMAQTGVPFGEVAAVRGWLKIGGNVSAPANAHPKRPVLGFACPKSEVSGRRLWGLFAARYPRAADFFAGHFVLNYCPLLFLAADEKRCANITPDKLSAAEKKALFAACDNFLRAAVAELKPEFLIGVGGFAEARLQNLFGGGGAAIGKILHPSPASPAANKGFAAAAEKQLKTIGVWE